MRENLLRRLREPPFGTETSERLLMAEAADCIEAIQSAADLLTVRLRVSEALAGSRLKLLKISDQALDAIFEDEPLCAPRDRLAAASDLLAALKRIVAIRSWGHDDDTSARREYDNAADDAVAAIAKAEGRS